MSKLFLLISLMGFISIKAFADAGEDKIKAECYKKSGNKYDDAYQNCLSDRGIFRVERNINSSDTSQSDARLCYVGDSVCDRCLAQSKGARTRTDRRNQIQSCLDADAERKRQASKPKPKPKPKPVTAPEPVNQIVVTANRCSKKDPSNCGTEAACAGVNGVWDGTACAIAPCPSGTTPDAAKSSSGNLCKCDADTNYWVERGTEQMCPSSCRAEDHKVYNIVAQGCVCMAGYEDRTGIGGAFARCTSTAAPEPQVAECIRELQDKVTSCGNAATTAVNKCNPDRSSSSGGGGGDTLDMMQALLQSTAGAADNCSQAAVAGSTGYYALEELRGKCDTEINSCKTSCSDATSYINANKQRVYEKCRRKAYEDHSCTINSPYRAMAGDETGFNAEWDGINKAPFEQQIQQMETSIADNNTKCESGTAVTNREKMSSYMNDMNTAVKSANQCNCQLTSTGSDCSKQAGPAECAANPSLPSCAQATINCLSAADNSPKCVCFKNPNSDECKNIRQATAAVKSLSGNASAFAGGINGTTSPMTGFGDSSSGGRTGTDVSGDLSGLNAGEIAGGDASGTSTTDNGSPFGSASGNGGLGGGAPSGNGSENTNATAGGDDSPNGKSFRGLFEVAKGAFGNLFKDKKNDKGTYTGSDGITRDADGNPIGAANKWRPRGMVRGLAGNETEIGGKFEDIWKVMNKQYKVQDQKDSFIFGEKN